MRWFRARGRAWSAAAFGEAGQTGKDAVSEPLPKCLETMLKDHLLLNAKRDSLAST